MAVRKFSNGILSRKKNVSLVVMASTTIVIRHSLSPRRSAATSSPKFAKPALRAIGSKRLSTRYCLSADSTRPDRSLSDLRRKSYSSGVTRGLPQTND